MPDKNTLIVNHLTQARANSPTYGKTGEDFKIVCKTFRMDLERFEPDVVDSAFNEWRHENSAFPHPSDITKICTRIQRNRYSCLQQAEEDVLQIGNRAKETRTQEDKDEIEELLSGIKAQQAEAKAKQRKSGGNPNPTHWNRMNDDERTAKIERLKHTAKNTKHGERQC